MDRKKATAVGLVLLIGIQLLCACGEKQSGTTNRLYVGVAYYDQSDTFVSELVDCFKEELDGLGEYEVTAAFRDAEGSQRKQCDQVEELIDMGCNVLCVNLVDRADPSEIIDLAEEHDVPIIFFNREPVDKDMAQWDGLYYVGADARQSGEMQGELAAEAIRADGTIDRNGDGKIQYVVLEGEPGHQDAIIRTENAVDTLKNAGIELEKLSYGIANWNRAQAQNRMQQMIGQYGDGIELVLANNDDMALGALDAYGALGYTESTLPVVFGVDGTEVGLEAVADGSLAGTVYNDKEGQAAAMAKLAAALVSGEGMEEIELENGKYIYLPYAKVTRDNVGDFMNRVLEEP